MTSREHHLQNKNPGDYQGRYEDYSDYLSATTLLVGSHGEPKVNLFHNIRIIKGLYYPKRLKVTYSTTRYKSSSHATWTAKTPIVR